MLSSFHLAARSETSLLGDYKADARVFPVCVSIDARNRQVVKVIEVIANSQLPVLVGGYRVMFAGNSNRRRRSTRPRTPRRSLIIDFRR
jgi:hypothetical protein